MFGVKIATNNNNESIKLRKKKYRRLVMMMIQLRDIINKLVVNLYYIRTIDKTEEVAKIYTSN